MAIDISIEFLNVPLYINLFSIERNEHFNCFRHIDNKLETTDSSSAG